jgi:hypothetical protein
MLPAVGGILPTLVSSAWTLSQVDRSLRRTIAKEWRQSRVKFGIARSARSAFAEANSSSIPLCPCAHKSECDY